MGNQRKVEFERKTSDYTASTSELLLENICENFGTELAQASINYINGTKLVRLSDPFVIPQDEGAGYVVQFQYTRFSPMHSHARGKLANIYNENRRLHNKKIKLEPQKVLAKILKEHDPWDAVKEVTDTQYIKYLNLHRWEKAFYFAVYGIQQTDLLDKELKPFLIHEDNFEFANKLPELHITFHIEPYFVIGSTREDTRDIYNSIRIKFPKARQEHRRQIDKALSVHPFNNQSLSAPKVALKSEDNKAFFAFYEVHSELESAPVMGFIHSYLKQFCFGKAL